MNTLSIEGGSCSAGHRAARPTTVVFRGDEPRTPRCAGRPDKEARVSGQPTSADIVGRRRCLGADYLPEGRPMSGKDFGPAQAPVRIAYGDDAERRRGAPSTQGPDALHE